MKCKAMKKCEKLIHIVLAKKVSKLELITEIRLQKMNLQQEAQNGVLAMTLSTPRRKNNSEETVWKYNYCRGLVQITSSFGVKGGTFSRRKGDRVSKRRNL